MTRKGGGCAHDSLQPMEALGRGAGRTGRRLRCRHRPGRHRALQRIPQGGAGGPLERADRDGSGHSCFRGIWRLTAPGGQRHDRDAAVVDIGSGPTRTRRTARAGQISVAGAVGCRQEELEGSRCAPPPHRVFDCKLHSHPGSLLGGRLQGFDPTEWVSTQEDAFPVSATPMFPGWGSGRSQGACRPENCGG